MGFIGLFFVFMLTHAHALDTTGTYRQKSTGSVELTFKERYNFKARTHKEQECYDDLIRWNLASLNKKYCTPWLRGNLDNTECKGNDDLVERYCKHAYFHDGKVGSEELPSNTYTTGQARASTGQAYHHGVRATTQEAYHGVRASTTKANHGVRASTTKASLGAQQARGSTGRARGSTYTTWKGARGSTQEAYHGVRASTTKANQMTFKERYNYKARTRQEQECYDDLIRWNLASLNKKYCSHSTWENTPCKRNHQLVYRYCNHAYFHDGKVGSEVLPSNTGQAYCFDTDFGRTDQDGDGCSKYKSSWCGGFDDDDFKSNELCCICKHGVHGVRGGHGVRPTSEAYNGVRASTWKARAGVRASTSTGVRASTWSPRYGSGPGYEMTFKERYNFKARTLQEQECYDDLIRWNLASLNKKYCTPLLDGNLDNTPCKRNYQLVDLYCKHAYFHDGKVGSEDLPSNTHLCHFDDLGEGKCTYKGGLEAPFSYLPGLGGEKCAENCLSDGRCGGFSVSDYGNCLLYLSTELDKQASSENWGGAHCFLKRIDQKNKDTTESAGTTESEIKTTAQNQSDLGDIVSEITDIVEDEILGEKNKSSSASKLSPVAFIILILTLIL